MAIFYQNCFTDDYKKNHKALKVSVMTYNSVFDVYNAYMILSISWA